MYNFFFVPIDRGGAKQMQTVQKARFRAPSHNCKFADIPKITSTTKPYKSSIEKECDP